MKIRLLAVSAVAAVALAGCATTSPGYGSSSSSYPSPVPLSPSRCYDCGIVVGIDAVGSGRTAPSKTGAVLGGIVGRDRRA